MASVLAVVHPLVVVLVTSVLPRGPGVVVAARLDHRLHNQNLAPRNIRGMMRGHPTVSERVSEVRANTMRRAPAGLVRGSARRSTAGS
ncbi:MULTISPECIES: hypothetical protein [unclassified Streptomyces]|uniref:hypothetical protein n=1 Tax=unclassified Streptomyces TaxID=2593676 RepID=UPI0037FA5614